MDESKRVLIQAPLALLCDFFYFSNIGSNRQPAVSFELLLHFTFRLLLQAVPTAKGQALADDYFIKFFRTVNSYAVLFCCFTDELILILFRTVFFRVPRLTSMWSKFSSPLPETLSRDFLKLIPSLRYGYTEACVYEHVNLFTLFRV